MKYAIMAKVRTHLKVEKEGMKGIHKKIEYNSQVIMYEVIRAKIKNMYIYVKNGKVIVKAPIMLKNEDIEEFINKKSKWIYQKIKEEQERSKIEEKIEKEDIERLEKIVKNSIEKYSQILKQYPNKVRIKEIKYAWGSCSSNKNISINKKLAKKDEKIIEYVVLHEMCHLKYMNHSKEFWNLVEEYMPKYKEYRKMLNR